jgi:hypothetical protein
VWRSLICLITVGCSTTPSVFPSSTHDDVSEECSGLDTQVESCALYDIHFQPGSSSLKPHAKCQLLAVASCVKSLDKALVIEGLATEEDGRLSLVKKQLQEIVAFLASHGVPQDLLTALVVRGGMDRDGCIHLRWRERIQCTEGGGSWCTPETLPPGSRIIPM